VVTISISLAVFQSAGPAWLWVSADGELGRDFHNSSRVGGEDRALRRAFGGLFELYSSVVPCLISRLTRPVKL